MGNFRLGRDSSRFWKKINILTMKKTNLYSLILVIFTIISLLIIRYFHKQIDSRILNFASFKSILLTIFIASSIVMGLIESKFLRSPTSFINFRALLIVSISIMLISSVFDKQVGIDGTGIFIICTLIYVIATGKIYSLNPIYLVVFTYPLLEFLGTIGTAKGFHFPEITYSFYLLPFAFSCFRLEKDTLLHILKYLTRIILIFIILSIIYWYYNLVHFDVRIMEWLTQKTAVNGIPAYKFVAEWSGYFHPTYINLVLLPGLISILYLFYKKNNNVWISKFEVILYVICCFLFQLLSESRVGFLAVVLILLITSMYYLHLKAKYFKPILMLVLVFGSISLFLMQNKVSGFLADPVRKTDTSLAISYIKTHPWWGIGFGNEHIVLSQQEVKMKDVIKPGNMPKTYVHNQLLGTMIQFGIPGAVILFIFVFGLFIYAFKTRSYLLQLFIFLYILVMLIEEPLYAQEGITRFMIFLAFFIHISESEKPVREFNLYKWLSKS